MIGNTLGNYGSTTKYLLDLMDDNHFIALIFTLWASPPEADKPQASIGPPQADY